MEHVEAQVSGPVVVGVDGSHIATRAAVWAAAEAASRGVALRLVSAWKTPVLLATPGAGSAWMDPRLLQDAADTVAAETASAVQTELGDGAPRMSVKAPCGDAARQLLDASAGASMLVLGTRGRGGFASLILGSVSSACVHHASVPTVVMDETAGLPGCGDVVVGVDGSTGSATALRWAATEAGRLGVRLIVVHGSDTPNAMPPGGIVFGEMHSDEFLGAANHLMADMIAVATTGLERQPSAIELRPIELTATQSLLSESKGAGLLVVGSRGRGGFTGLLLGSVSQQCIHHAACPVVVVPRTTPSSD